MYQRSYSEVLETGVDRLRSQEIEAFQLMRGRLVAARDGGAGSEAWVNALQICQQFWRILIRDLSSDETEMPAELQSNLISIGLWSIRTSGELLARDREDIEPLVEIHQIILTGLTQSAAPDGESS